MQDSESSAITQPVDWLRLACPQTDSYDTERIFEMAENGGYARPTDLAAPRWLDDAVAIDSEGTYLAEGMTPAPADHPNVAKAADILRLWPEMYAQCRRLLHKVAFFVDPRGAGDHIVGSVCGPGPDGFGSIATTVNNHVGLAEAIVHELAHHKLRAMGIDVENAEHLILNAPERLYPSPIRYDSQRPMTAVVHAQYSYCHIAELDLRIVAAGQDRERDEFIVRHSLAVILPKLMFGKDIIEAHIELDPAGEAFMAGFADWIGRILTQGDAVLSNFEVQPQAFTHPLLADGETEAANDSGGSHHILDSRPRRLPEIESHVVSDGMVLYRPSTESAHSLNSASRAIWELCDGNHSLRDIAAQLGDKLGVGNDTALLEQLAADVVTTVRQFEIEELLAPDAAADS